jgi:hypothetical protein
MRRARSVAIGQARQIVADHFLVVLEAAAGQQHRLARLDINSLAALFGFDADDFLGDTVLYQLAARRLKQNFNRPAFDGGFVKLPGVRVAEDVAVVKLVRAIGTR